MSAPASLAPVASPQPAINVADVVGAISNIAALPEIAIKINDLVKDPQSTSHDLNRLIAAKQEPR